MLTAAERVLLLKILGLMSSPVAGERSAAAWKACELATRAGGWDAVISTATCPEVPQSFLDSQGAADLSADRAYAVVLAKRRSWTRCLTDLEIDFALVFAGLAEPSEAQQLFFDQIQRKIRADQR